MEKIAGEGRCQGADGVRTGPGPIQPCAVHLDNAKVDKLALQCGKTSDQIRAMRDSGMGWGRTAKECGGHGMGKGNGKGKNKAMMDQSMDEKMTQDMDTMSKGNSKSKKPKKK